jgi:hypothetical protein
MIAEVLKRREQVAATRSAPSIGAASRARAWQLREPILQLEDDPFRRLLADAGNPVRRATSPRCTRVTARAAPCRTARDRQLRADAADADQRSKSCRSSS